jgi:hypothetical protein
LLAKSFFLVCQAPDLQFLMMVLNLFFLCEAFIQAYQQQVRNHVEEQDCQGDEVSGSGILADMVAVVEHYMAPILHEDVVRDSLACHQKVVETD